MIHAFIKKGCFQDSVSLMIISRKLSESENVDDVSVMMGTPANKSLLETTGFWHDDFNNATPNDICVAIRTETADESITQAILQQLDESLQQLAQATGGSQTLLQVRRWESACQKLPEANMTLISVAGEYAAELANQALDRNLNVMMFSDNVTLEDEITLKRRAQDKGLLVMGPDCGTAMIAGTPLAFANVMPEGNIGVLGASGTGIQELCSQIALAGEGITHAIGLGGRDLSAEVGGISALTALEMLGADDKSQVLAFVSKPPAEAVRQHIVTAMKATGKPVVALFLGYTSAVARDENVWFAATLDDAARLACLLARVAARRSSLSTTGDGVIRGLYTGGTLAAEAAGLLAAHLNVTADAQHHHGMMLDAAGHQIIDLGDDFYTVGRPHPMIDPALRNQLITDLGTQPQVRVLLVDVVIGYGATADPAASLVQAWQKACAARGHEQPLYAIATVTGTERDPQCRSLQIATLEDAGIAVVSSLPEATLLAAELIRPSQPLSDKSTPPLLEKVAVINAGLRSFALDLQAAEMPVVHYQWAPVAGGNKKLARLLERLQ
ncbi:acyl-CoA synthetase FdrA [Citrobacter sp. TBCS-15]|uniref:Acyl-CoA synthetase FdrA n=1 Tax=Citrobacter werkmanii TaxID=67827 RepID=A0AA37Z999_9ENTR|nr:MULTISPECIES: acyl-CoA synthetase FdrA [Citrobacter]MEC3943101.1 acyl-CoA synthetase FdrA [Citrobacter werkmanii]TKT97382.1 acyl-CoA synthetase FdrA [Citrobacter sp. TBCS-15]HAT7592772.1 acyl-CoA synthetase FdrA [Citrobacter werkmanii]HCL5534864.1 acyl-CoA synthetase FdrA [Citrobacter werkmanii]HED1355591.1 acyl-CoA synthetase FdrA [Citrobacter werkmanii]